MPDAARGHAEADLIDGMLPVAAVTIEFAAGTVMIGFSLIYLALLGDISLGAFLHGVHFTWALVIRLLVLAAALASAALLGLLLTGGRSRRAGHSSSPIDTSAVNERHHRAGCPTRRPTALARRDR